jgi:hypothetical protein
MVSLQLSVGKGFVAHVAVDKTNIKRSYKGSKYVVLIENHE